MSRYQGVKQNEREGEDFYCTLTIMWKLVSIEAPYTGYFALVPGALVNRVLVVGAVLSAVPYIRRLSLPAKTMF